jgi:hypothetical protein
MAVLFFIRGASLPYQKMRKMKTATLIRIFALFPLLGILLPDLSIALCDPKMHTPLSHIVTCIGMAIIVISAFLIERYQSRMVALINKQQEEA